MAKNNLRWLAFILLLIAFPLAGRAEEGSTPRGINVLASSSLTSVMTEIIRIYSRQENISVSAFYDSPFELAKAIESGEIADIYISEDQESMASLKRQGLIDVYTLSNLAQNSIVLAASVESHLHKHATGEVPLEEILKDMNEKAILVIGDPDSVPIGRFAKQTMEKLGYWEQMKPFIARVENDIKALYHIAKGKKAGIVYRTDAFNNSELSVLSRFPTDLHDPVIYQAAVVAGLNMKYARQFLDFLKSAEGKKIFEKHGFVITTN